MDGGRSSIVMEKGEEIMDLLTERRLMDWSWWPHKTDFFLKDFFLSLRSEEKKKKKRCSEEKEWTECTGCVRDCLRFSLIPLKDEHNDGVSEQCPASPNMHHKSPKQKSMCSHNARGHAGK